MQERGTQDFEFGKGYLLKGYKKKSRIFGLFFTLLSLALVVSFSIFSANLIVGVSYKGEDSVLLDEKKYYLLSLNSYEAFEAAKKEADEVRLKEGAGYIYQTGNTLEVVAFAYSSESDCINVKSKVEKDYPKSHILLITCKKITASIDSKYKAMIYDAVKSFDECYAILYSLASSYETSKEYYTSMNLINELILQIESKITSLKDFNSTFSVKLKTKLKELVLELESLVDVNESVDTFESRIKYSTCAVVVLRKDLGEL